MNKTVGTIFFISMSFLTVLLVLEYHSLRCQLQKVVELKEEYRDNLVAVKKALKEIPKASEELLSQKKNGVEDDAQEIQFPDNARIFSSDLDDAEMPFVIINRDLEYLKQSTFSYVDDPRISSLLKKLNHELWQDYIESVLAQEQEQKRKNGKKRSAKKRVAKKRHTIHSAGRNIRKDMFFSWPINRSRFWMSSFFGARKDPKKKNGFHYGIDMAAVRGTPVKAAASGVIKEAGLARGYGNTVLIAHNNKYKTRYAHLDRYRVMIGQKVTRGQIIGNVGDTGYVRKSGKDASHLHFEVYAFGKRVNPMCFLS